MSASLGATAEERLDAVLKLKPDIATVIVGSMNYGLFRKAENQGISEFKLDWEKEAFGPKSYEIVTNNSFAKIAKMMDMLEDAGIAAEFEVYDVGHLYVLEHHLRKRNLKKPLIVQFLTGILGGSPSEIDHLLHLKRTAERLFGPDLSLFTHGTGLDNIKTAAYGAHDGHACARRAGGQPVRIPRQAVPVERRAGAEDRAHRRRVRHRGREREGRAADAEFGVS